MKRPQFVYVVNNGKTPFKDRFDGEDIVFPPGEAVDITIPAATLIFGFGEESKDRAIRRLGWAPTSNDMPAALERLGSFQFHMERPVRFHMEPPGLQPAPQGDEAPSIPALAGSGGGSAQEGAGNDGGSAEDDGPGDEIPPAAHQPSRNLLAKLAGAGNVVGG